ncbi:MAG: electron transporter RnfD [Lachnospiraceae bacterium]|nr:electron transporter RnfD [Lachnospiraceae bacterium]
MSARVWMKPADPAFSYEGRIDHENVNAPVFVYPASYFCFRMKGKEATLLIKDQHSYFENSLGILVDGEYRGKILLHDGERLQGEAIKWFSLRFDRDEEKELIKELELMRKDASLEDVRAYDLTPYLDGGEHEITVFKRMDACHYFTFCGVVAPEGSVCRKPKEKRGKERRVEVYGDSISCGEVSEAISLCGGDDPDGHNGIYSNSFYSYPWILARMLGARLHDVAQGGISLRDGEGYFDMPNTKGMLSCYDKIENNPSLGERKPWDFTKYVPHVVIVAIGQNDAHPENYMAQDYDGEKSASWRKDYAGFVKTLRGKYPKATIVLTTTILGHDPAWDRAIEEVCEGLGDQKVVHFLYEKNGCGTSGHVRRPEAEKMAQEMKTFLESLGDEIWED